MTYLKGLFFIFLGLIGIILVSFILSFSYSFSRPDQWTLLSATSLAFNAIMALMFVGWLQSLVMQRVDHVDIYWGLSLLIAPLPTFLIRGAYFHVLVMCILALWSFRLQIQIKLKHIGKPEDIRYQNFRRYFGAADYWWFSFYQVFVLQGFLACLIATPLQVIMLQFNLNWLIIPPLCISIAGIIYEGIADYQLYKFKQAHQKGILTTGLFAYSRHPNYFGEILVWLGFTLAALTQTTSIIQIIGSLLSFALLTYLISEVSGVKMTARVMHNRPGYQDYSNKVPALIPKFF